MSENIGSGEVAAVFDPKQMERILDNLLDNSMKYGERDSLRIEISLTWTEETARIRFADNGVGVQEEKLPFIFDQFYRADESRNRKEGNGLGSGISAERLGG